MIFFNVIDIHRIFYILGTLEGDLIKELFALILFILITYMVTSEYTRDPRRELKYMVAAFGALALEKLVSVVVLTTILFGKLGPTTYRSYFPVIGHTMEIFALILLANAFLFPIIAGRYKSLKKSIMAQAFLPGLLFVLLQASLIIEVVFLNRYKADVTNYWVGLLFNLMKIVILLYAVTKLSTRTDVKYRYRYSVIIAFLVYFVTPFLTLINIVFYEGTSARLAVAGQPFPLLAVLLFTRVIYLKLVDKVFLRKKLKESEQKYKHEKELGKMKDKFVSVVSHELRTPLTSINLYTSLLRDGRLGKVNDKQKESLSIIKNETLRLSGLISDILDLSKLEEGKMKLRMSSFDLHEFVDEIPSVFLAKQKNIKFVNKVKKGLVIRADADKFKQVLINLFSNAIKYTKKDGKIIVNARSVNGNWEITVADTGIGIKKESLSKIFDKFYQVEHYMTRKEGGSGLGLAIVYELIKLHKGDIKATSKVGKGTKFIVTIPKT